MIWLKQFFLSNQWNKTKITKNGWHPENEPHTAKIIFLVLWSIFTDINENFSLGYKKWISLKET